MQVTDAFAQATLIDTQGETVVMESLWEKQPAVIVFLRHFGCMFCREQATQLAEHYQDILDLDGEAYAIGNGTAKMAKEFAEAYKLPFPLYTDPSRKSYELAGFQRKLGLGLRSFKKARETLKSGHRQGRTQGDAKQQGGGLVILTGGDRVWSHIDRYAGDLANIKQMVSALRLSDNGLGGIDPSKGIHE